VRFLHRLDLNLVRRLNASHTHSPTLVQGVEGVGELLLLYLKSPPNPTYLNRAPHSLFQTDALARSLSDLLALVKLLREDVAHQRQEIAYLRMLLENCAGCKNPLSDNQLRIEPDCRSANPCYPGKCDYPKSLSDMVLR